MSEEQKPAGPAAMETKEPSPPTKRGIDDYVEELRQITDNVGRGTDAIEFMAEFWSKLGKIEQAYADSVASLCNSRTAKLQRIFSSDQCEPVTEMEHAWKTGVADLQTLSASHNNVAKRLKETSVELYTFSKDKLTEQGSRAAMSRRVVQDLKSERTKLGYGLLRYRKLCKDAYDIKLKQESDATFDPAAENPDLLQAESLKTKQAEVYKAALNEYEKAHHATFETAIPGLLTAMQDVEQDRITAFKESISRSIIAISECAGAVSFADSMDALAEVTSDKVKTCEISETAPKPPTFVEPTIEQLYGQEVPSNVSPAVSAVPVSTPAKDSKTQPPKPPVSTGKPAGGFFSSWFSPKKNTAPIESTTSSNSVVQPPNMYDKVNMTWQEEAEAIARAEAARKQSLDASRQSSLAADALEDDHQRSVAAASATTSSAAWSELDDTDDTDNTCNVLTNAEEVPGVDEQTSSPTPSKPVAAELTESSKVEKVTTTAEVTSILTAADKDNGDTNAVPSQPLQTEATKVADDEDEEETF